MPPAKKKAAKRVTRYTHDDAKDPRTPETGHTALLPEEESVVTVPMDSGGVEGMVTGKLPDEDTTYVVDMDPSVDPVLLWSGKRSRRDVPVLPLQRNEIVSESRISQIIERVRRNAARDQPVQGSFFADLEKDLRESDKSKRVEFYTHDEQWRNKLICGDSLPVMESMIRYEGLAGAVQMLYFDPPYGIKYDANFQQRLDTTKNQSSDLADDVLTIRAFRDTWSLGVHSYLSYLQERFYLFRELLTESGSVFVQIGEENLHRVRILLDEVFGAENYCSQIAFVTTSSAGSPSGVTTMIPATSNYLLWYSKNYEKVRYQQLYLPKSQSKSIGDAYSWIELRDGSRRRMTANEKSDQAALPSGARVFQPDNLTSQSGVDRTRYPIVIDGKEYRPGSAVWKTSEEGMNRLLAARRVILVGKTPRYVRYPGRLRGVSPRERLG